ncbi:MAG: InlB B-repeat-containing protein, partial [Christensenellales bacterium]
KLFQIATYSRRPKFRINIPSYSKLTNITIVGASVNLYAFTSATTSTYAKGFIEVNFDFSTYKKYNYTLNCYSTNNLLTLDIEIYFLGPTDKVVFVDYANKNDIKDNANLSIFAIGDNYSDITLQSATGAEDVFYYWSTDKYGKTKLSYDSEQGFILTQSNLTSCTQISNYTWTKDCYTAILFPYFVKNDFNVKDYIITDECSVSKQLNHTIISATGGTGEYEYSIVSGMPNGLTLDGNVIRGTPTQVGLHKIVIAITDKVLKVTKQATLSLFVSANNKGVYQTEWYDISTSKQILEQGSLTWSSLGPGGLHQEEQHKFALSDSGILTCECRNYTNQANLYLPNNYALSHINFAVSNGHGGFDNYQLKKGGNVTFTPYEYTGASNAMIVYKVYMIPNYNIQYYLDSDNVYHTQKVYYGQNYQLISVPSQDCPSDLIFLGWSKQQDFNYLTSTDVLCTESTNYYAVWQKPVKLIVEYNGNGYISNLPEPTVSSIHNQVLNYNLTNYKDLIEASCVVANNLKVKEGYTFGGWDLSPDGTEKRFLANDSIATELKYGDVTITLYAIFDEILYNIQYYLDSDNVYHTQKV